VKAKWPTVFQHVEEELRCWRMLLVADAALPSVASLVAQAPTGGSWWAHSQSHAIFKAAKHLASHPDVLTARLLGSKVTFIHKKLWPALMAVGTSREPWQLEGLSPSALALSRDSVPPGASWAE
jgi:hypothetical protein